ncbi:MAG: 3-keto-5-aminohexanoate cleavage protein [Gemmatimonadetes bacterium]|nr:3-keto-5-aminohexanoate cleavage protein [Gemmatimonadota bacterium]
MRGVRLPPAPHHHHPHSVSHGTFLQVALNGDRVHPAAPRTPAALAEAAAASHAAGAHSVHVHAYTAAGHETLGGEDCAAVLRAIRARCPGLPVSLTTSATILPDPRERVRVVTGWHELPDLITANQGEPGIIEVCHLLLARGVQVEAGLLTVEDAHTFVRSGLAGHCRRVLIEPLEEVPEVALRHAAAMEAVLATAGIALEQVHHGYGAACWAVNRRAVARGHGIRTGFEDVTVLPDGSPARDNAALVTAAAELIRSHDRSGAEHHP